MTGTTTNASGGVAGANRQLLAFLQRAAAADPDRLTQIERWATGESLPLVEALQQKGLLREDEIADALARQLRLPLVDLTAAPFDPAAIKLIQESIASRLCAIPIRSDGAALLVALANPLDLEAIRTIEFLTGRTVRAAVAPRSQVL